MRQDTDISNSSIRLTERGEGGGLVNKGHTEIFEDGFVRCGYEDHPPSKGL